MDEYEAWDQQTAGLLEEAYTAAGAGPAGSGCFTSTDGQWRAKRQHLTVPMDAGGAWLDVGCANGHLMSTLPRWAAENGIAVEAYGLELLPRVADLARSLHPQLADRIWTGSVMSWTPRRRFRYVTVLDDAVPPGRLGALVDRLLGEVVASGGRLILSSYTSAGDQSRDLLAELVATGYKPNGLIHIDRPQRPPLQTVWLDR